VTPRPYTLVAELTHRCPLACAYCANPTMLVPRGDELDTRTWCRVLDEAAALGVLQVHLTGGEPLARTDLELIVAAARRAGLYTNLITSGVPLTSARLDALVAAGLDAVQLSLQDVDEDAAERMAGAPVAARKLDVARWVKGRRLPLTLNVVLHRDNVDRVGALIALAERLGADRLELANAQYLGWALVNRAALLPTRAQVDAARTIARAARDRLRGRMEITLVLPDYHRPYPKACMDGWGRRYLVVTPSGRAQPCHLAGTIDGLAMPSVRDGIARRSVDRVGGVPRVPRRRVDARAVSLVRAPRRRLRRLPLPGVRAHRRRGRDRSRMRARARSRARTGRGRRGGRAARARLARAGRVEGIAPSPIRLPVRSIPFARHAWCA
jgi:PqqA peptide cyclase